MHHLFYNEGSLHLQQHLHHRLCLQPLLRLAHQELHQVPCHLLGVQHCRRDHLHRLSVDLVPAAQQQLQTHLRSQQLPADSPSSPVSGLPRILPDLFGPEREPVHFVRRNHEPAAQQDLCGRLSISLLRRPAESLPDLPLRLRRVQWRRFQFMHHLFFNQAPFHLQQHLHRSLRLQLLLRLAHQELYQVPCHLQGVQWF